MGCCLRLPLNFQLNLPQEQFRRLRLRANERGQGPKGARYRILSNPDRTITELLAMARTPAAAPTGVTLSAVLDDLTRAWHGRFAVVGRPFLVEDISDAPMALGNGAMLRHALDVLVDNALVHGAGVTRIDHHVGVDTVTISVSDEGAGVPSGESGGSVLPESPQPAAGVHGLGLPLARRLIEAMPGRLNIVRTGPHPQIDIVLAAARFTDN